ncbi:spermatid-specific manchette-related protein 1 isoform X1 [Alligator sinensis]|uniref:Spermatid-specific manchette-related protein 1 isoform X1 n=1 Tax=Alligator sinensis TaxID=38654 RepID=A0A3Q0FTY0_ALLSI|nr:spermatid-specific manchette-related protein 1 isoform X1 [Alligator sinensis]
MKPLFTGQAPLMCLLAANLRPALPFLFAHRLSHGIQHHTFSGCPPGGPLARPPFTKPSSRYLAASRWKHLPAVAQQRASPGCTSRGLTRERPQAYTPLLCLLSQVGHEPLREDRSPAGQLRHSSRICVRSLSRSVILVKGRDRLPLKLAIATGAFLGLSVRAPLPTPARGAAQAALQDLRLAMRQPKGKAGPRDTESGEGTSSRRSIWGAAGAAQRQRHPSGAPQASLQGVWEWSIHCPQAWLVAEQVLLSQRPSTSPATGLGSPSNVFAWMMTLLLSAVGARKGIRVPGETEGSSNPLLRPRIGSCLFSRKRTSSFQKANGMGR